MTGDHTAAELMTFVGRSNRSKFREQVLAPLLALGVVEMTIPDKPNSSKQRYRLTAAGRALKAEQRASDDLARTTTPLRQHNVALYTFSPQVQGDNCARRVER